MIVEGTPAPVQRAGGSTSLRSGYEIVQELIEIQTVFF